nr:RNA-directed DNA polymerase, eukaryota, reverse transcriptase zinc-binding domain protein [Tanacetum cinerariifolium]
MALDTTIGYMSLEYAMEGTLSINHQVRYLQLWSLDPGRHDVDWFDPPKDSQAEFSCRNLHVLPNLPKPGTKIIPRNCHKVSVTVGSLKAKNPSLLGKWWWCFRCEKHALWCKIIAAIHKADGGLSISMGACLKRDIGNGEEILFWKDEWCVCWNWKVNARGRSLSGLSHLTNLVNNLTLSDGHCDGWLWRLDSNNLVSVKKLSDIIDSRLLAGHCLGQKTHSWNRLVPRKVNIFVWRAVLNRLPVLTKIDARGIYIPSVLCPLCEDVLNL